MAGASPRPIEVETFKAGNLFSGRAATWGRPYRGKQTGSVGSAKPGAEGEPQRWQFLQTQGPVARNETIKATQILRAGNSLHTYRYASPVMGDRGPTPLVKGRWPKARGDREGEYGHGVSILSRPPAILWFFSHHWERNSPPTGGEISLCTTSSIRILPPHPSGLRPATFPPGGRLREKRRNTVSHKILLPTFLLRKVGGGEHPRTNLKFLSTARAA